MSDEPEPTAEFTVKARSRNGPEMVATGAVTVTVNGKPHRVLLEASPWEPSK